MPFAITLLVLLAAACAMSSAIPQGATWEQYAVQYGERTAALILALGASSLLNAKDIWES